MRPLLTTLLGILVSHLSFSQQGNIQWVPASDGPAGEKHFRYTPPAGKEVPENAVVKIIHMPYRMITVDLKRDANGFGFAAKLPDTTAVCLMAIMDKKNNIADNNGNRFYTVQLGASADEGRPMYKVERLQLTYWANFSLGGKVPPQEILEGYEAIYASHPEMKFDPSYFDYVRLKHQEDPEKGRVLLQAFAEANIKKGDEQGYRMAIASYYSLKDQNKVKEVQAAALQQYPAGEIARNVFMDAFYEKEEKTDEDILEAMDEYKARFGDTSAAALSTFYMALVRNAMLKG
ncbi:MAG TPA: hypothetical protein VK907_10480, partial [Phnomibacter sp.]|nr:hypothetical protein [Phnomibacter sp.]